MLIMLDASQVAGFAPANNLPLNLIEFQYPRDILSRRPVLS